MRNASGDRRTFDQLLSQLRPKLHRYCARMTGSVIDGEDVVQAVMVKALSAWPSPGPLANSEGWLFRIAHNASLDFLRRQARMEAAHSDEDTAMIADPATNGDGRRAAAAGLRTFMRLPIAQRSTVILKDVLGYSVDEIAAVLGGATTPAVKAALHRGRTRLREFADEPENFSPPELSNRERTLLSAYIDRFNARDFDAVRDMLADEVRLDLVAKSRMSGRREVGSYLHNYSTTSDWHFVLGFVEGRPAVLACDPDSPSAEPLYFVLLNWDVDKLVNIRDFRYARYVTESAELVPLG
jgi:RNA polymerase sigma-70 factor (ECF subfamily)